MVQEWQQARRIAQDNPRQQARPGLFGTAIGVLQELRRRFAQVIQPRVGDANCNRALASEQLGVGADEQVGLRVAGGMAQQHLAQHGDDVADFE